MDAGVLESRRELAPDHLAPNALLLVDVENDDDEQRARVVVAQDRVVGVAAVEVFELSVEEPKEVHLCDGENEHDAVASQRRTRQGAEAYGTGMV